MNLVAILVILTIVLGLIIARELYISFVLKELTGKVMTKKTYNGVKYHVQYKHKGKLRYKPATMEDIRRLKRTRKL